MAHPRQKYTVLIGYPKGGGHWTTAGETVDLMDVEAHGLRAAGRIKLTSEIEAEKAAASATKTTKATKDAE
ncbi:hypothetical protein [Pseudomonas luteola]|uniref:hypothetical protein n=1 Tax=Pseudomonas luteola TaxID=47886 RepID=UPI0015E32AB4|nr:hypothetical protein [Pseudomonas zeshuii]MBA1250912.1 hypothetical protein [Pseudomonas zeshuii]